MSGKAAPKTCAKVTSSQRAKLPVISDEMKRLSAMLEQEVSRWPGVQSRPMFGMFGLYRDGIIFAALPRTRALHTGNSIIFKFDPMPRKLLERAKKDQRITWETECRKPRWYSFGLDSADDVSDALSWLEQAYEAVQRVL